MVTWLPRESATTPRRRSIKARFWPYCPNSVHARRLSSKVSTVCVVAVSFASLVAGTIPLSVGRLRNASGSERFERLGGFWPDSRPLRERAEQAIGSNLRDRHGYHRADQMRRRHDLHRLKIGRAAGELTRQAARLFEQDVERCSTAVGIEGGSIAVDRRLKPGEAFGFHLVG